MKMIAQKKIVGHRFTDEGFIYFEVEVCNSSEENFLASEKWLNSKSPYRIPLKKYFDEVLKDFASFNLSHISSNDESDMESEMDILDEEVEYVVDKILARRWDKSILYYEIDWAAPYSGCRTWEPAACLTKCQEKLYEFLKQSFSAVGGIESNGIEKSSTPIEDFENYLLNNTSTPPLFNFDDLLTFFNDEL